MDDQMAASVKGEHDPFPAPVDLSDAAADEHLVPAPGPAPPQWSLADSYRNTSSANQRRSKVPDDRLNFRQLGHGIPQEVRLALGLYGTLPSRTTPIALSLTLWVAPLTLNFPAN